MQARTLPHPSPSEKRGTRCPLSPQPRRRHPTPRKPSARGAKARRRRLLPPSFCLRQVIQTSPAKNGRKTKFDQRRGPTRRSALPRIRVRGAVARCPPPPRTPVSPARRAAATFTCLRPRSPSLCTSRRSSGLGSTSGKRRGFSGLLRRRGWAPNPCPAPRGVRRHTRTTVSLLTIRMRPSTTTHPRAAPRTAGRPTTGRGSSLAVAAQNGPNLSPSGPCRRSRSAAKPAAAVGPRRCRRPRGPRPRCSAVRPRSALLLRISVVISRCRSTTLADRRLVPSSVLRRTGATPLLLAARLRCRPSRGYHTRPHLRDRGAWRRLRITAPSPVRRGDTTLTRTRMTTQATTPRIGSWRYLRLAHLHLP
mmetsp:Transcript_9505/g.28538  ORF Transcript_9505/g.28538 Transcript_9505/m.28538 type:complete len:364 (-) Transcript_9505:218-1309(-)